MDIRSDDVDFNQEIKPIPLALKEKDPFYEKDMSLYVKEMPKPTSAATQRE